MAYFYNLKSEASLWTQIVFQFPVFIKHFSIYFYYARYKLLHVYFLDVKTLKLKILTTLAPTYRTVPEVFIAALILKLSPITPTSPSCSLTEINLQRDVRRAETQS